MSNQQTSAREARISVFFPLDAQIIYGYFPESGDAPEQKANQLNNDKPAETKDQVIHDAKIQIENMMRRAKPNKDAYVLNKHQVMNIARLLQYRIVAAMRKLEAA